MSRTSAKARCRITVGDRCLDDALPQGRLADFLGALLAGVALLAAAWGLLLVARAGTASPSTAQNTAPAQVELATPHVPARPVEGLERIDLSTQVRNPSERAVENVRVELTVRNPDGTNVLSARQGGISLQPHDSRAVYWSWRVPAQMATGEYAVEMRAFDSDGRPLSGEQPSTAALVIVGRSD